MPIRRAQPSDAPAIAELFQRAYESSSHPCKDVEHVRETVAGDDHLWLVSEGLKDGDRIVVDGFQKFVPGDKVKAKAWIDADASVGSVSSAPATQAAR